VRVPVRAVIFDYFGTLARTSSLADYLAARRRIAELLGVDPAAFLAELEATYSERATGLAGHDTVRVLRWLARRLGTEPGEEQLAAAARLRLAEFTHVPIRAEAVPVLSALRRSGLRTGLVSDCSCELPAVWPRLPVAPHVDAVVFSFVEGVRKPDLSLYLTACRRLGVAPHECVYVGDGGSNELSGARAAGMFPVRLLSPDHEAARVYELDTGWDGPVVTRLDEVLDVVDRLSRPAPSRLAPADA
jgi:putative hydrolase of the HAD superfamily